MDLEQSMHFFSNARVLKLLDDPGRKRLLQAAEALTLPDGAVLVREGEAGDALFLIVSGIASVSIDNFGESKPVAELTDGAFFGEMAVITNQARSATVIARGELAVLKIPKQQVQEILADYPKMKELVAKVGLARTEDTMDKMLED